MIALSRLKEDMAFTQDLASTMDAFKTAAMVQFRLFSNRKEPSDVFLEHIRDSLHLLARQGVPDGWFLGEKDFVASSLRHAPKLIVAVTSNEGFLGDLNMLVINHGLQRRTNLDDEFIVIGDRGANYCEDHRERFTYFPGMDEDMNLKKIARIQSHLLDRYGRSSKTIEIVFPEFVSFMEQHIRTVTLLPYVIPEDAGVKRQGIELQDLLVEPDAKSAGRILAELWVEINLHKIFYSAKKSEYAARILHLEGSLEEINYLKDKGVLAYFRQIHALRDKTIREISVTKILLNKRSVPL